MPFTVTVLVVAVLASWVRGGRLQRIAHAEIHAGWVLFVGVAIQLGVDVAAGRGLLPDAGVAGWSLLLSSQVLVVAFLLLNRRLPGVWLVAAGLALNAAVMAANRAMPVDPAAITAIGMEGAAVPPGKHTLLTAQTHLPWLADIIPVPWLRSILSVGDLVLAAGLVPMTHALMTSTPPPSGARRRGPRLRPTPELRRRTDERHPLPPRPLPQGLRPTPELRRRSDPR
ncbi:MAG: DUF5317 domain-containing protein [Nitriliruptoraceae bacterium]